MQGQDKLRLLGPQFQLNKAQIDAFAVNCLYINGFVPVITN